jgi:uncharacterized membrane protein
MPMQATTTTPLFSARLRPERSLRLAGGWIALTAAALACLPFMVVLPEAILPVGVALLLTAAGLAYLWLRQSRQARITQQVTLWTDQIEIATVDGKGVRALRRLDPHAVRMLLERDENEKVLRISLRQGGDSLELGAFLSPDDKASFARAFGSALRKARRH